MIVFGVSIPVLGIIAGFSMPAFRDYTIRTRVAEGIVLASSYKAAVTDYYETHGHTFPKGSSQEIERQLGLRFQGASQNVRNISVLNDGIIEIEFDPIKVSAGRKVLLVPQIDTSGLGIRWECKNGLGDDAFKHLAALPRGCRS